MPQQLPTISLPATFKVQAVTLYYIFRKCINKENKAMLNTSIEPEEWALPLYLKMDEYFHKSGECGEWFDASTNSKVRYLSATFLKAQKALLEDEPREMIGINKASFLPILVYSGFAEKFAFLRRWLEDESITELFTITTHINGKKEFTLSVNEEEFDRNIKAGLPINPLITTPLAPPRPKAVVELRVDLPIKPVCFFGRADMLYKLAQFFSNPHPRGKTLLLSGVGGMGKTSVMQEFLHDERCQHFFNRIVCMVIDHNLPFAFISSTARALNIYDRIMLMPNEETQLRGIVSEMSRLGGENLFVIDNVNETDIHDLREMRYYFDQTGWRFLITSRTIPDGFLFEEVTELDLKDAKLLFTYHFRPDKVDKNDQRRTIQNLNSIINDAEFNSNLEKLLLHIVSHTLLTELLAKYSLKRRFTVNQIYQSLLEKDYIHPDFSSEVDPGVHGMGKKILSPLRLHTYILGLFDTDYLFKKTGDSSTDSENEMRAIMLLFFSMLPSTDIPINDLVTLFGIERSDQVDFEIRLDELRQMGWLQSKYLWGERPDQMDLRYKMHMLVQKVVDEKLSDPLIKGTPLVDNIAGILGKHIADPERFHAYVDSIFRWYEKRIG
ncbi:NB-ARC domain-containing protein [Mucilaginibacter gracilis]|uniref:NB-ARC domain-containing protein n=1 Tax=Mucilaginibacter gracilis TaxID=423350 RepID=A0A495JAC6_9SPHI|nr:ATP-binding protein [Mucilaginibacter gracilis]RKR85773.1 NB-ARC domain-containing protein [Mucilaginibacter gracilis]